MYLQYHGLGPQVLETFLPLLGMNLYPLVHCKMHLFHKNLQTNRYLCLLNIKNEDKEVYILSNFIFCYDKVCKM